MVWHRLPQLLQEAGVEEHQTLIRDAPHKALQNLLNLRFPRLGKLLLIPSSQLVEQWLANRSSQIALRLLSHIQRHNPFMDVEDIAQIAWLLLGSIIPRGVRATESSQVSRIFTLELNQRSRNLRFRQLKSILKRLTPITLANDTVRFASAVSERLQNSINKANMEAVKIFNILHVLLETLQLESLQVGSDKVATMIATMDKNDQIQATLENVLIHMTENLNLEKRQQVRRHSVKYHLPVCTRMLEEISIKIDHEGENSITEDWWIDRFCVTGYIDEERELLVKTFGSPVLECNHLNHLPFDSNPINTGRANNLVNQTQKICSVNKLSGCRCSTGQCTLKLAWIESSEYFEKAARAEQGNPLSQYAHCSGINQVRWELALDTASACAKFYYPPPAHLILILMGFDTR